MKYLSPVLSLLAFFSASRFLYTMSKTLIVVDFGAIEFYSQAFSVLLLFLYGLLHVIYCFAEAAEL